MKEACENYMEGISSKLEEFEHNLITKASITTVAELSKMVEELSIKELREKPVPAPQKDSREAEMIAVSEIEERAKRSSNEMLFNLKESGESAEEIKRDDEAKLKEIARIMDTKLRSWKQSGLEKKRLEKPPTESHLPKPWRKECCSRQGKKNPYQQWGNGKNLEIKMDLTPKQRQEEKQLLSERNKRRDEETSQMHTWIIRSGKILRTRSTQRAQTSLAEADHYSHIVHCKNVEPWL